MKPALIWTQQAREDLIDIYITIALENESAAEKVSRSIQERIESLIELPRLGIRRRDIRDATRMLVQGIYLVLYETHPDTDEGNVQEIAVIRIVHGHRNLTALF